MRCVGAGSEHGARPSRSGYDVAMPTIDAAAGEITIKITYHAAGLAGRTTNLQYIYNKTRPGQKSRMVSFASETERSCFFDLLPLSLPAIGGLALRIHLVCSPGCRVIEGAKERVLADADGVVFVIDSQEERADANTYELEQLEQYIARQGRALANLPLTLQYNKQDLHDARPIAELDAAYNRYRRPSFAATATTGLGVFDTLKDIIHQVITPLREGLG